MRVTVDVSPAVHHHAGLGRYAHELLAALAAFDPADEFTVFFYSTREGQLPEPPLHQLPFKRVRMPAKPWRLSVLLAYLAGASMDRWLPAGDVFHATDHLLPPLRSAKSVFTIHDLIFRFYPEYHLRLNRWFLSLMMPRFVQRADAVIAVSESTRRDVLRLMSVPQERITVIYEGVNPAFHPRYDASQTASLRAKYHLPQRFVLYLGTIEPRKNLVTLLEAYRGLVERDPTTPALVIAGRKGWLYQSVFDRVRDLGLEERVQFTGYVKDGEAPTLLSAAELFVFPSLYEGFGLPPLEAMACGTPLICSNASSLPEVVGEGGIMFDPHDVRELSGAMNRVLCDERLRNELRARGVEQASRFSWERAAAETLSVYQTVFRGRNGIGDGRGRPHNRAGARC
jgi:glycosyltransferase involved in cell wall biosynthesis